MKLVRGTDETRANDELYFSRLKRFLPAQRKPMAAFLLVPSIIKFDRRKKRALQSKIRHVL